MLVPDAAANPEVALVVELNQVYVGEPEPPVGTEPVSAAGVVLVIIDWLLPIVLPAITGLTVIAKALVVSVAQTPELTTRLYQVFAVNAAGEYPDDIAPDIALKPVVELVVELNQA